MRRIITALIIATICNSSAKSERILETVLDPANPQHQNAAYLGRVLIASHGDPFLLNYDDVTFTRIDYPIVSGLQLRFDSYWNPLVHFESAIFFVLGPTPGVYTPRYLYRFTGASTFTRIAITGNIVSNCIVYGRQLYFLSDVSGTIRLFRYSGGVVTEVTGAAIPSSTDYRLHATGGNLYITGSAYYTGTSNFIRRYNGTSFLTLPWSDPGTSADQVLGVPGTSRVYFISHERILYYNGTTVRQVFFNAGEAIYPRMWRNDLFFTTGIGGSPGRTIHLYRLSGAVLTEPSLPAGYQIAPVVHTNPEIYSGLLYVAAEFSDGSSHVLQFNGSTFDDFYTIPTPTVSSGIRLHLREGNLIIHPNFPNGNHAFEYNGTDFTEIIAPAGRLLFPYINSTDCNHLWLNYYSDASGIHWAYAKESKDCPPPPTPPGPVAVIPDSLRIHERFEAAVIGTDRGWCWSEIIIDWDIEPICPLPPCPEPNYQLRMIDANNGIAWSEFFSKPSKFMVPLKDDQPFGTILSSADSKTDLLVFDPDLVSKGIESIKLSMLPKKGFFMISVSTRKQESVPLRVALLNEEGKEIWMQTFTAPFSMQITATVQKAGKTLVFSIPDEESKFITQAKDD